MEFVLGDDGNGDGEEEEKKSNYQQLLRKSIHQRGNRRQRKCIQHHFPVLVSPQLWSMSVLTNKNYKCTDVIVLNFLVRSNCTPSCQSRSPGHS